MVEQKETREELGSVQGRGERGREGAYLYSRDSYAKGIYARENGVLNVLDDKRK